MTAPERPNDVEAIVDAFADACRRGLRPDVATWVSRHPEHADALRTLLPAVALLERHVVDATTPPTVPVFVQTLAAPSRVAEYRIVREIGRGGMGVVFEAIEEPLNRRVALKLLLSRHLAGASDVARFQREAEVASRLEHRGICTVLRAGIDGGIPFIAMRFVEGETLHRRICREREAGQVPSRRDQIVERLRIVRSVASALHDAHERGVVHRDVKPQNIMIDPTGEPVILDFGLARDVDGALPTLTRTGDVCGTPAYLAPETLAGNRGEPDPATDIYALGVTLFECLTLRRPFDEPTIDALYHSILRDPVPDPHRLNPAIDRDLTAVIQTALEKEPMRRYQTAAALAADLRAVIEGHPVSVKPLSTVGRIVRWSQREPAKALLAVTLVVLVPIVAGLWALLATKMPEITQAEQALRRDRVESAITDGYLELGEASAADARACFERALDEQADCVEAIAGVVMSYLAEGKQHDALGVLDAHPQFEAHHPSLRFLRAGALERLGRRDDAERIVTETPQPADAIDCFLAGIHELERGHGGAKDAFPRALALIERADRLSPIARHIYVAGLAHATYHCNDHERAAQVGEKLITLWPKAPSSWHWRGFATQVIDRPTAEASFRKALELGSRSASTHSDLAHALAERGAMDEAIREYEEACTLSPTSAVHALNLAAGLEKAGATARAVATFRRATELAPTYRKAWMSYGGACLRTEDVPAAIAAYGHAVELAPPSAEAWSWLGTAYGRSGDAANALEAQRRALAIDPDHAFAHASIGTDLLKQGHVDEAIEMLARATRLDPTIGFAFANLAAAYSRADRLDEARAPLRQCLRLQPGDATAFGNLRILLTHRGDLVELVEICRSYASARPKDADAASALASALLQVGLTEEALAAARRAVELRPDDPSSHAAVAEAFRHMGRLDEALDADTRAVELAASASRPTARFTDAAPRDRGMLDYLEIADALDAGGSLPPAPLTQCEVAWTALVCGRFPAALAVARQVLDRPTAQVSTELRDRALYVAASAAVGLSTRGDASMRTAARGFLAKALDLHAPDLAHGSQIPADVRSFWCRILLDPRLAAVRDASALAAFDEAERTAWAAVWGKVRRFVEAP